MKIYIAIPPRNITLKPSVYQANGLVISARVSLSYRTQLPETLRRRLSREVRDIPRVPWQGRVCRPLVPGGARDSASRPTRNFVGVHHVTHSTWQHHHTRTRRTDLKFN